MTEVKSVKKLEFQMNLLTLDSYFCSVFLPTFCYYTKSETAEYDVTSTKNILNHDYILQIIFFAFVD